MTLRLILPAIFVAAILWQAFLPRLRLTGVVFAAACSCAASALLGGPSTRAILEAVPWDVLVILVALGALTSIFAEARLFERIAVIVARVSRGDPRRLYVVVAIAMFFVSGLVNNLTALLLVMPVVLVILRLLAPNQRYTTWSIGLMLVACNLGGAATPIGDFPAILLLGAGRIGFVDYLKSASVSTFVALALLIGFVLVVVRPSARLPRDELTRRITLRVAEGMYRGVTLRWRFAAPAFALLGAMLLAWTFAPPASGISPELVAWTGAALALVLAGTAGERVARASLDAESVLFLLALFVMVGAVRATGLFEAAGQLLLDLPVGSGTRLVIFLIAAAVLTGLFSAGPSMAALLEVADVLARDLPSDAVYVGLALSVCAGSSLFLTAATSGPLAQSLVDRAGLRDAHGGPLSFGFREFVPVGVVAFVVILSVGIAQALVRIA